jgi:hypothetical protein
MVDSLLTIAVENERKRDDEQERESKCKDSNLKQPRYSNTRK